MRIEDEVAANPMINFLRYSLRPGTKGPNDRVLFRSTKCKSCGELTPFRVKMENLLFEADMLGEIEENLFPKAKGWRGRGMIAGFLVEAIYQGWTAPAQRLRDQRTAAAQRRAG
jgi:hypothetical protein